MTERDPGPDPRPGAEPAAYGGPASSMALLLDLLRDSGDPGYAEAAARREAAGESAEPTGVVHGLIAFTALALVGVLLAAAVAQTRRAAPTVEAQRAALVGRIESATATTDDLQRQVEALTAEVAAAEAAALSRSDEGRAAAANLLVQKTAAQYTPVEGPGAEVSLEDAENAGSDPEQPEVGKVLDRDLQLVVNGLWRAGAEAITVNGIRLSSRTAIRAAGGAILVDYRPLLPPYRVAAIGDRTALLAQLDGGATGKALAALRDSYGIRFSVTGQDLIAMAAATSTLPVLAEPLGGTP